MSDLSRWSIAIVLVLLVPIIPFLGFGESLDHWIEGWFVAARSSTAVAAFVAGVLASDVLLPVPSSFVSTLAGARLGLFWGTLVVWMGMNAGAVLGFALARWLGRPLAARLSAPADLRRMELLVERGGPAMIALCRALPVLAEASVLLVGSVGLPWRRFLPIVLLANLGLAVAYAALGHFARAEGSLAVALVGSIALPVLATLVARHWLPTSPKVS